MLVLLSSEVACPYFYPLAPSGGGTPESLHTISARKDAMLPLGDAWSGVCRALPGQSWQSDESVRPTCNLGYARGVCARFPAGDGPDAVRFTVARDRGSTVALVYVVERDHHPFAHGSLEYALADGAILTPLPGDILTRQAQAYGESYRRRKECEA